MSDKLTLEQWPCECWLIHGLNSCGEPWVARDFIEQSAIDRARRMNILGARMTVTRQTREPHDLTWTDVSDVALPEQPQ